MDILYSFPPFALVLGIIVFFHEFGHFLVGRWCGARIEVFSMGFGHQLCSWVDRRGTTWRIAAVPLGGYVRYATTGDDGFLALRLWKRAAIIVAGPLANFVLAIVVFTALFLLNGRPIEVEGDFALRPVVGALIPGHAAEEAGLKPGDLILAIDGAPVRYYRDLGHMVDGSNGKPLAFRVRRAGAEVTLNVTPQFREVKTPEGTLSRPRIGVRSSEDPADLVREWTDPLHALGWGAEETWKIVAHTGAYVGDLFAGRQDAAQLTGPIGIAEVTGEMAQNAQKTGIWPFFNLIGALSVSIGLLNLMPVPMLDGGHLLFYAIEAARGRALRAKTQQYAFRFGLAMVGALMLFSTYNDLYRLIRRLTGGDS